MPDLLYPFYPGTWLRWATGNDCESLICHFTSFVDQGLQEKGTTEAIGRIWSKTTDSLGSGASNIWSKLTGSIGTGTEKVFEELGRGLGKGFSAFSDSISAEAGQGIKKAGIHLTDGLFDALSHLKSRYLKEILPVLIFSTAAFLVVTQSIEYFYKKLIYGIGRPRLAIESHQIHWFTPIADFFGRVSGKIFSASQVLYNPVFNQEISRRVKNITESVRNIRQNGGFFQHLLLHGPAGTGKTMLARKIAKDAGMNYVFMSGGDLAQYIKRGEHVSEFNKLMDSVERSSHPTVIFIDEAESFAGDRGGLKSELLELQNAFLNRTGTQTKKFMLILSTNRVKDLDPAVMNRMDHKIFIGPPKTLQRAIIVEDYTKYFFSKAEVSKFFSSSSCMKIAQRINGFTGRTIFKMLNALHCKKAGSKNNELTQNMVDEILADFIKQERGFHKEGLLSWLYYTLYDLLLPFYSPCYLLFRSLKNKISYFRDSETPESKIKKERQIAHSSRTTSFDSGMGTITTLAKLALVGAAIAVDASNDYKVSRIIAEKADGVARTLLGSWGPKPEIPGIFTTTPAQTWSDWIF